MACPCEGKGYSNVHMRCCYKRRTNATEGTKETKHLDARGVRVFNGWLVHAGGRSLSSSTVLIFTLRRSTRSNDATGPKNGPPGEVLQRSLAPGRAQGRAQRVHKEAQGARTRKDAPVRTARDGRRIMFLCQKKKTWSSSFDNPGARELIMQWQLLRPRNSLLEVGRTFESEPQKNNPN